MSQPADFWRGAATGAGVMAVVAAVVITVLVTTGATDSDDAAATPTATVTAEAAPQATEEATEDSAAAAEALAALARNDADDPMAMGDLDAPVLMLEWADLRCHYCGVFAQETLPTLVQEYVDAGVLRIEWHSAPVLGDTSEGAVVAAYAAAEQDLFWEFIDAIYATSPTGQTVWSQDALVQVAQGVSGLDVTKFTADLSDPEIISAATAAGQESLAAGVSGTPHFLLNGHEVSGAQPLETFQQYIEGLAG